MVIRWGYESLLFLSLSTCLKGEGFTHSSSINTHPGLPRTWETQMAERKKVSQNKLQTHYRTKGLLPWMGVNIINIGHGSNFSWSQTEKLYLQGGPCILFLHDFNHFLIAWPQLVRRLSYKFAHSTVMLYKQHPHSSHVHTLPAKIWAFQRCRNIPPMGPCLPNT